jgi:indole-3-glycerol phosphate synthase
MSDRLSPILADARARAASLARDRLAEAALVAPAVPSFVDALVGPGLAVVAEVKRRSPSRGDLDRALDPVVQADRYAAGGAAAISVLTEPFHFAGSDDDLLAVRRAVPLPVLRKDFTVDDVQVDETRVLGASAVLLIVAALDQTTLARLLAAAVHVGLDALVEVHDEEEAARALDAGAVLVGVNNRDLSTFDVDLATAERVAACLGGAAVTVAESGIWCRADARRMHDAGYDAVLVGEALVRADDPAALLRELRDG